MNFSPHAPRTSRTTSATWPQVSALITAAAVRGGFCDYTLIISHRMGTGCNRWTLASTNASSVAIRAMLHGCTSSTPSTATCYQALLTLPSPSMTPWPPPARMTTHPAGSTIPWQMCHVVTPLPTNSWSLQSAGTRSTQGCLSAADSIPKSRYSPKQR